MSQHDSHAIRCGTHAVFLHSVHMFSSVASPHTWHSCPAIIPRIWEWYKGEFGCTYAPCGRYGTVTPIPSTNTHCMASCKTCGNATDGDIYTICWSCADKDKICAVCCNPKFGNCLLCFDHRIEIDGKCASCHRPVDTQECHEEKYCYFHANDGAHLSEMTEF